MSNTCPVCKDSGALLDEICPLCDGFRRSGSDEQLARSRQLIASTHVSVTVMRISGDTLEVDAFSESTVEQLKRQIGDAWNIPPLCQKLTVAHESGPPMVLKDKTLLGLYIQPCIATLTVMLIIAVQEAIEQLSCCHYTERTEAAAALGRAVGQGNEHIIGHTVEIISNPNVWAGVKGSALALLLEVAEPGDARLLDAVKQCLRDPHAWLKLPAVRALGRLAPQGDVGAIEECIACLENVRLDNDVQQAVAETLLHQLAGPGHLFNVHIRCLYHHRQGVRRAALATIHREIAKDSSYVSRLIVRGLDQFVALGLQDISRCCTNCYESVTFGVCTKFLGASEHMSRKWAIENLACVAERGDERVILALKNVAIEEQDQQLRCGALKSLGTISRIGDAHIFEMANLCSEDPVCFVRIHALKLLVSKHVHDFEFVTDRLRISLKDKSKDVRQVASKLLWQHFFISTKRL